ncbi:hTAFII28-like protein conserved region-domain-containing protein [Pelagophyceae sp. CCMP2097]|nr:hTAFII28-like protein conserved region-domain-containing protein [Pelagophyceae sp. CCMP2097]
MDGVSIYDERDPEKLSALLETMSEEELDRFEQFRRSRFNRGSVNALLREYLPEKLAIPEDTTIAVACLAKLYVGDLVRTARGIMDARGATGPITPDDFLIAARRLERDTVPTLGDHKRPRLNGPPVITRSELLE